MLNCKCSKSTELEPSSTRMVTFKKDYQWTIQNYFEWANTAKEKEESPIFQLSRGLTKDPCLLAIRIYAKGDTKNNQDALGHLTVYLVNKSDFEVTIDYKLYLETKNGSHHEIVAGKQRSFASTSAGVGVGEAWGNRKAMKVAVLEERKDEYLPRGSLIVGCQVTLSAPDVFISPGLDNNLKAEKTFSQGMASQFDLTNPECSNNYKWLSDFQIQCGQEENGKFKLEKTFNCHKIFLSLRSPVFKAMFLTDNYEVSENNLSIDDISSDTVEKMLGFIYTDNIKIDVADVELLYAADKYKIGRLKSICEKQLAAQLSESNAAEIAIASHMHGSKPFKREVMKYVAENWSKLKATKESEKIRDYPEMIDEMLSYLTA